MNQKHLVILWTLSKSSLVISDKNSLLKIRKNYRISLNQKL